MAKRKIGTWGDYSVYMHKSKDDVHWTVESGGTEHNRFDDPESFGHWVYHSGFKPGKEAIKKSGSTGMLIKARPGLVPIKKRTSSGALITFWVKPDKQMDKKDIGEYKLSDLNAKDVYNKFKESYEKETGTSWSEGKFMGRASKWTFYGNSDGFVAVRPQKSGLVKMVGIAGSPKAALLGYKKMIAQKKPVWGMMSDKLAEMSEKMGMIRAPAMLIKLMMPRIPKEIFGGVEFDINKDGSVTFEYKDVGKATKYFVGSKQYYEQVMQSKAVPLPGFLKKLMTKLITRGK